jgi:hypothetical protein
MAHCQLLGGAAWSCRKEDDMTVPQPTAGVVGMVRKPIVVILLSIITIGIYSLYWQYASFKELKTYSGEGIGGGLGLLFAFLIGIVNVFMLPLEVGRLYAREGQGEPVTALTGFWVFLPIVGGIIWIIKVQGRLNDFWIAHGAVTDSSAASTSPNAP